MVVLSIRAKSMALRELGMSQKRVKRYWSEVRPFEINYPYFDDDRKEEQFYREQVNRIIIPDVNKFVVEFTFVPHGNQLTTPTTTTEEQQPAADNSGGAANAAADDLTGNFSAYVSHFIFYRSVLSPGTKS